MPGHDWSAALTLTERRGLLGDAPDLPGMPVDAEALLHRHQDWANRPVHATVADLEARLAADGLSLREYAAVSAGVGMPASAARPAWAERLDGVCREWAALHEAGPELPDEPVRAALESVVAPFATALLADLRTDVDKLRTEDAYGVLRASDLAPMLARGFAERARNYAYPAMAAELHVERERRGLEPAALADVARGFLERARRPGGWSVLRGYPVLARLLAELSLLHRHNAAELARQVRDDAGVLVEAFLGGAALGELVEVGVPLGDHHAGGACVRSLRFSGGLRLLHKPRPLAADAFFARFLRWLNGTGVEATQRPVQVVDRGHYGWVEFVDHAPCASEAEVERFYRRQGGLLAACHVLAVRDLHFENLLAAGEHPVAVDLEALFQPPLPRQHGDPPFTGGSLSIRETRLLPLGLDEVAGRSSRFDRSGIAGRGGGLALEVTRLSAPEDGLRFTRVQAEAPQRTNLPVLDGEAVPAGRYAAAVEAGFREVAGVVRRHAAELTRPGGLLDAAASARIRVFFRPTDLYARVLASTCNPDALRDMLNLERVVDVLWPPPDAPPAYRAAFLAERQELLRADVPVFTMTAGGREVRDASGRDIGVHASRSGLDVARERVLTLDGARVDDLAWVVRASIAQTQRPGDASQPSLLVPRPAPVAGGPGAEITAADLRARAAGLADLVARRTERGPDGVTWAGFSIQQGTWMFGPLGRDLYYGNAGVVLFLAYAGACTGEQRYTRLASAGLDAIRSSWERQLLGGAPARGGVDRPPPGGAGGACDELGGTVFTLTHLSVLWSRDDLAAEALVLCEHAAGQLDGIAASDVTNGLAGTIAVALTLHRVLPDDRLVRLAARCGELLEGRAVDLDGAAAWPSGEGSYVGGFAHGAGGIAASLARLARVTGEQRWRDLAARGRAFEDSLFLPEHGNWLDARGDPGAGPGYHHPVAWCVGAAGTALARAVMDDGRDPEVARDLDVAVGTTAQTVVHRNHSLCHGSFGKLLALRRCAALRAEVAGPALRHLVPATVETLDRHGAAYPLPDRTFTPGLMLGAAGIGYALLALADPALPSLLALDDLPA